MFSRTKAKPSDDVIDEAGTPIDIPDDAGADASRNTGAAASGGSARGSGAFLLENSKPSVISEGFLIVGDVTANGILHVEGSVRGAITTEVVNIGSKGSVNGRVTCKSLQVKGVFEGIAECDELVVSGRAKVSGTITYRTLSIQRGAQVEGDLGAAR